MALTLSIKAVRRAYWKGEIPYLRIGRLVRFDLEEVKKSLHRAEKSQSDQREMFRQKIVEALEGGTPGGASRPRAHRNAPDR